MSVPPNIMALQSSLTSGVIDPIFEAFGFNCALIFPPDTVYDPITGKVTVQDDPVVVPAIGIYGGTGTSTFSAGLVVVDEAKTLVRKKTKTVYLKAGTLTQDPNTDVTYQDENGNVFNIVKVEALTVGGPTLMWQITVKT